MTDTQQQQQEENKENCCTGGSCPKQDGDCGPAPGYSCPPPWQGCGGFPPDQRPFPPHHHHHPPPPPGGMPVPPHMGGMHPPCGMRPPPPHMAGMHPFGWRGHFHRGERGRFGGRRQGSPEERDVPAIPYLYYMDAPGLAEQVRLCFVLGGVPFVDKRMTSEEWQTKYKAFSPTGTMPFMTVGNSVFSQSRALLLYAARRGDLIPTNVVEQTQGLTMIGILADSINELASMGKTLSQEERIPKLMEHMINNIIPKTWARLNTQIQSAQTESDYALGNKFTYVDAAIAGTLHSMLSHVKTTPFESTLSSAIEQHLPAMKKIMEHVYADNRVIDFMRKSVSCPTLYQRKDCWHAEVLTRYLDLYSLKYNVKVVDDESWNKETMPILPWLSTAYTSTGGIHACFEWIEEWLSNRELESTYSTLSSSEEKAVFGATFDFIVNLGDKLNNENLDTNKFLQELGTLKKMLASTRHPMGFVMGSSLTFLDVLVSVFYERLLKIKHGIEVPIDVIRILGPSARLVMEHPNVKQAKKSRAPIPKLYYFNSIGMVEGCRLMFHAAQMPFEDITFNLEEWKETYQAKSLTGRAPWLEVDGVNFYELTVVNDLVGELTGFQPETMVGRYAARQLVSYYATNVTPALRKAFSIVPDKREAYYVAETVPLYNKMEELMKLYQTHEHHAVENRFTWIDFFLAGAYEYAKVHRAENKEGEPKWPAWKKIRDAVYSIPEVQDYVEKVSKETRFDPFTVPVMN